MQLRQIEASLVIISSVYFAGTSYVTNINGLRPHASNSQSFYLCFIKISPLQFIKVTLISSARGRL